MQKFWGVPLRGGVKQGWGETSYFFSFMRQYLENGMSKVTINIYNF